MNIPDDKLLAWNRQGLIAGPEESSTHFLERIDCRLRLAPSPTYEPAKEITLALFDFRTDWIDVRIQNRGLRIWEAAATWIHPHATPTITLKKRRRKRPTTEEIVAHEMLHAMRSHFPYSKYEECMAYYTSTSSWRKTLGPLFDAPWEPWALLLLYYASMLMQIWSTEWGLIAWLFPLAISALLLIRLSQKHYILRKALMQLSRMTPFPLPMLIRLTDDEIALCAQGNATEILAYAKKQNCLRWRAITLAYLNSSASVLQVDNMHGNT